MDISSLLSPQDPATPASEGQSDRPSPESSSSRHAIRPAVPHRTSSTRSHPQSPLVHEYHRSPLAPTSQSYNAASALHHSAVSAHHGSVFSPPPSGAGPDERPAPVSRHTSTPQMDTLAELAVMQQPTANSRHQTSRSTPIPLREAQLMEPPMAKLRQFYHALSFRPKLTIESPHMRPLSLSSSTSADVNMTDAPSKHYAVQALTSEECAKLTQLSEQLINQPSDLTSHMDFVKLLHDGFMRHVSSVGEPEDYSLLSDLRNARDNMVRTVPIGEALWLDWLHDERLLAKNYTSQVALVELHRRSVAEEPASVALWRSYGDHVYYMWSMASDVEAHSAVSWSSDEKAAARQQFTHTELMRIWEQAVNATKHNICDSNIVWDRYIEIIIKDPTAAMTEARRNEIRSKFEDRLLHHPHRTWDTTLGLFSEFVSSFATSREYEKIMVAITEKSKHVKQNYEHRSSHEFRISQAKASGDEEAERQAYLDYLAWEVDNKGVFSFPYINSLYERAVTRFWNHAAMWVAYVEYLISNASDTTLMINVLERATRHCPWSGDLWSHRLLTMEKVGRSFQEVDSLKHQATATGLLELGGLEELIKLHNTWCGYLRRKAFEPGSTEEQLDIAHIGIVSALEYVHTFGKKTWGDEWKGDPQYRLERTQIEFFTQRGEIELAREVWRDLVDARHDSQEFWYRFYVWELMVWSKRATNGIRDGQTQLQPPQHATAVLREGLSHHDTIDSPETLLAVYQTHCEQHESPEAIQRATIESREMQDAITKRRYREYETAQQEHRQQSEREVPAQPSDQGHGETDPRAEQAGSASKRKREESEASSESLPNKRSKEQLKRDRENASVLVSGLPLETTDTQIRQLFSKAGKVNMVTTVRQPDTLIAIIEFEAKEEADYAKLLIKRYKGYDVEVKDHNRSSIWCANYPPVADKSYIRSVFERYGDILDIRFPSTVVNARRRFCYVDFLDPAAATRAQAEVNGLVLDGEYKLVALISDPSRREERAGAIEEHREVFMKGLDFAASEDDVREFFESCGTVTSVRIARNENGRSKGYAHVQFKTPEAAQKAVEDLNGRKFPLRRVQVELSVKKPSIVTTRKPAHNNGEVDTSSETRELRTVGLANIPGTVNLARVEKLAAQFGEVRTTTFHAHRGTAIVEYVTPESAANLELQTDKLQLDGQQLSVVPVEQLKDFKSEFKTSRIGEKPHSDSAKARVEQFAAANQGLDPGKIAKPPRKKLGLGAEPRFRGSTGKFDAASRNGDATDDRKKKSNDDFRKMFMASAGQVEPSEKQSNASGGHIEDDEMEDGVAEGHNYSGKRAGADTAPEDIPLDDLLAGNSDVEEE